MAARNFNYPNVGASGRRRIVPMMGIDFIAGQIERKGSPIASRTNSTTSISKPYGQKPPSIGGRTRVWSYVNFLNVESNMGRQTAVTANEQKARQDFGIAAKSADATAKNLAVLAQAQADFLNNTIYGGVVPNEYATYRGWLMAIRRKQISNGVQITATTNTWPPVMEP